jgi:phosphoenolpyruvate synthase/pyruvate phosphate dikinase
MVRRRVLRSIRSKETSQTEVVRGSKRINGDILNNIRRDTIRHFRNEKREYMRNKINELAMNSENKYIRDLDIGINKFKMGYQPRSNSVKDENADLLEDSPNI